MDSERDEQEREQTCRKIEEEKEIDDKEGQRWRQIHLKRKADGYTERHGMKSLARVTGRKIQKEREIYSRGKKG